MDLFLIGSMDIYELMLWFFIYSFCGWCMECVVIRHQKGYWENRGFAKLPFCIIYGFGVYIALHLFAPIQDNYLALYICGCIGATALEYITAQIMLKLFGEVWWDYSHLKFQYKGILCLESTLAWGLLALFIFGFFNRYVELAVLLMNHAFVMVAGAGLTLAYLGDFSYHFIKKIYEHREARQAEGSIGHGADESYE